MSFSSVFHYRSQSKCIQCWAGKSLWSLLKLMGAGCQASMGNLHLLCQSVLQNPCPRSPWMLHTMPSSLLGCCFQAQSSPGTSEYCHLQALTVQHTPPPCFSHGCRFLLTFPICHLPQMAFILLFLGAQEMPGDGKENC